ALVPEFDAKTAARMARELFTEMAAGKEAGRASSRAQASLVRATFRSALARCKGAAPPASVSHLADRRLTTFDETDLELALAAGQATADTLKIKKVKIDKAKAKAKASASPSTARNNNSANRNNSPKKNDSSKSRTAKDKTSKDKTSQAKTSQDKTLKGKASATTTTTKAKGSNDKNNNSIKSTTTTTTTAAAAATATNTTSAATTTTTSPSAFGAKAKKKKAPEKEQTIKTTINVSGGTGGDGGVKGANGVSTRAGEDGGFWVASTLLQECLACNHTAGAEIVLDSMEKDEHWARTSTYNTLLWYFRQERDAKGALGMLQSLRDSKTVAPDKLSYTLAIQACVWSGSCVEEAWAVVEQAERAEVAFGSKDLLDARLALVQAVGGDVLEGLKDMASRGVSPDEGTLLGVIEACAERGDTKSALDVLQMMRGAAAAAAATTAGGGGVGVCPRPSYRSYLAALAACSRAAPAPTTPSAS
ncbi:unnamed protein product, partial [Laminaria digitata]